MDFFDANFPQMADELIYQLLADSFVLVFRINTDRIQSGLLLEDAILTQINFAHDKSHNRTIFQLGHQ